MATFKTVKNLKTGSIRYFIDGIRVSKETYQHKEVMAAMSPTSPLFSCFHGYTKGHRQYWHKSVTGAV